MSRWLVYAPVSPFPSVACMILLLNSLNNFSTKLFPKTPTKTRLLNYTPQATIVRLLAVNALNGYLTSWVLYLAGSSQDDRLLLPAWIAIATILTAIYHTTQRKINIRKETNISISVFSIASFASMLCLLAQLHSDRAQSYPAVPAITFMRQARSIIERIIDMEGRLREGYG